MSEPPLVLRRARPQDAEAFVRIMGDPLVQPQLLQLPFASVDVWQQRLAEPPKPGLPDITLVAERGGVVLGHAGLFTASPSLRRRHAAGLGIAVAADAQGRGVGSALMQALIDYADGWVQLLRIELTVFTDNERAIRLYRGFGFEVEGTHRAYAMRDGVYADVLSMARLHPRPPQLPAAMSGGQPGDAS